MTELYNGNELQIESRRKKTWLTLWWCITSVILLANVGIFVYYCFQPYEWSGRTALFAIQIVNVAIYACLSFAFFALKYRRLRAYCKMLKNMNQGLKEIATGDYIGVSVNTEVKEGVDFHVLLVMEWNDIKAIYFERKVLIDVEKEIPEFHAGEMIHFVTQANMLMSYEVLERSEEEPTMEQKRKLMAAKDKERLFDNVIIDEDALKKMRNKKGKKSVSAEASDSAVPKESGNSAEVRESEAAAREQDEVESQKSEEEEK